MARPLKKGLDYFPLDVDFFQDKETRILKAKFGVDGVSIYLYLLCEIYRNGYYLRIDDDFIYIMADDLRMSSNKIKQVLNFLLERSLFDSKLFQTDKVLTSAVIQEQFQLAVKERAKKTPIEVEDFWVLEESKTESFIKVKSFLNNSEKNVNNSEKNNGYSQEKSTKKSKVNKSKINKKTERVRARKTLARFEEFLSIYPKECNRYLTEIAYASLVSNGTEKEETLIACAKNYAEACRIQGIPDRYIKNAENFLKEFTFEIYLPSNYKKPAPQKSKNSFNDFEQRNYDFEKLERELLGELSRNN